MKKLILILVLFLSVNSFAQVNWKNAESSYTFTQSEKLRLIYFSADWCKWCRQMEQSVFNNDELGNLINTNFTPVKINESDKYTLYKFEEKKFTSADFVNAAGVTIFPSIKITSSNLVEIENISGYISEEDLKIKLRTIIDKYYEHN